MKRKRIKLVCDKCGTQLRWKEDFSLGLIKVEPCPECLQQMTKEQRIMYERGKEQGIQESINNILDNLGTTHECAAGIVVSEDDKDINYSC